MNLEFRMSRQADEASLVEFWNQNSDWGSIDLQDWRSKFMSSPLGPATFALAVDKEDGAILAQFGFIPSLVSVYGREVSASRPVAVMVRRDIRKSKALIAVPKLILQLYNLAARELAATGVSLIHMVPDHRWARLFKMMPSFKVISFPLYTLPLPLVDRRSMKNTYTVQPLSYEDPDIDLLWEEAKDNYNCMVVRNREALRWKNSHRNFRLWGLYEHTDLVGLFTCYLKDKNRKWQICDVLYKRSDNILTQLIAAACLKGQEARDNLPEGSTSLREIEIFPSLAMEPIVLALGFKKVKYKFSMVVHQLDRDLPKELAKAENWYVSPNE